jgi:hypothetical protein
MSDQMYLTLGAVVGWLAAALAVAALIGMPRLSSIKPVGFHQPQPIICCFGPDMPCGDGSGSLGSASEPLSDLMFDCAPYVMEEGTLGACHVRRKVHGPAYELSVPVKTTSSVAEILRPVVSKPFADALQEGFRPELVSRDWWAGDVPLYLRLDRSQIDHLVRMIERVTFAANFQALMDGQVVAEGHAWYAVHRDARRDPVFRPLGNSIPLKPIKRLDAAIDITKRVWSLRIQSDPEFALRDFDADCHWEGEVTVPLKRISQ